MSMCELYKTLPPEDRKRLLRQIIPIYVSYLIERENIPALREFLDNVERNGLLYGELVNIKRNVDALYEFNVLSTAINGIVTAINNRMKRGKHISESDVAVLEKKLDELVKVKKKLESFVSKDKIANVEEIINQTRDTIEYIKFYNESLRLGTKYSSSLQTLIRDIDAAFKSGDLLKIIGVFDKGYHTFENIRKDLVKVIELLDKWSPRTKDFNNIKKEMRDNIYKIVKKLAQVIELCTRSRRMFSGMLSLNDKLSKYGKGDNFLANRNYRAAIVKSLTTILNEVGKLFDLKIEDAPKLAPSLASSVWKYLSKLKRSLSEGDYRWIDVFEEAERLSRTYLPRVSPQEAYAKSVENYVKYLREIGWHWLADIVESISRTVGANEFLRAIGDRWVEIDRALSSWVNDIREANMIAFRSDNFLMKAGASLGLIGASVIDFFTTIARPSAVLEQLRVITEMINGTLEAINKYGLGEGIKRSGWELLKTLFGTPERALMSIGAILSGFVLGKLVAKLPVSPRVKAVLTGLLQADPFDISIAIMTDVVGTGIFRGAIRQLAASGKISKIAGIVDEVTDPIVKAAMKYVKPALKESIGKISYGLRKIVGDYLRKGEKAVNLEKAAKELIFSHGLKRITKLAVDFDTVRKLAKQTYGKMGLIKLAKLKLEDLINNAIRRIVPRFKEVTWQEVGTHISKIKKGLEELETLHDAINDLYQRLAKYTDLFENVDELMAQLELAKRMLTENVKKAKQLIENVEEAYKNNELIAGQLRVGIMRIFEQLGMEDIAREILNMPIEEFLKRFPDIAKKLTITIDMEKLKVAKRLMKPIKEIEQNKVLKEAFRLALSRLTKTLQLKLSSAGVKELSVYAQKILGKFKEKLPRTIREKAPEFAKLIDELYEKAKAGKITIEDINRLSNEVAKVSPELASMIDLGAVLKLIDYADEIIDNLKKELPEATGYLKTMENKLREYRRVIYSKEKLVAVMKETLHEIAPDLKYSFKKLIEDLEEIDPKKASKLREVSKRIFESLSKGVIDKEAFSEAYKVLSDIARVPGIHSFVKKLLIKIANKIKKKATGKVPESEVMEPVAKLADIILEDLKTISEIPDGWGFIYKDIHKVEYTPILAPKELVKRIRQILAEKEKTGSITIDDIKIGFKRVVRVLPDGTLDVHYILVFPEDRMLWYRYTIRSIGKGKAAVYERLYFDPPLEEAVQAYKAGLTDSPLYRIGKIISEQLPEGRLFEMGDPDFTLLRRVAIISHGNKLIKLGNVLGKTITAYLMSLPPLTVPVKMKAQERLWDVLLTIDKPDLIRTIKPYLTVTPSEVQSELKRLGIDSMGYLKTEPPIVIGLPGEDILKFIKRWIVITFNGKQIPVPILKLPSGLEVGLIPAVDVNTKVATSEDISNAIDQALKEGLDIKKAALETELQKLKLGYPIPPPAPPPPGAGVAPVMIPGAPVKIGLQVISKTRKGKQVEILYI